MTEITQRTRLELENEQVSKEELEESIQVRTQKDVLKVGFIPNILVVLHFSISVETPLYTIFELKYM